MEHEQKAFTSPSKATDEKEQIVGDDLRVYVLNLLP